MDQVHAEQAHTEQNEICKPCVLRTVREMMQDRGYKTQTVPPLPMPHQCVAGYMFVSDGQSDTTDMQHDVYGLNYQQQAVVLFIDQTVSIIVAREMMEYRKTHDIARLIVVITAAHAKATPQVNAEFTSNDIELFPGIELVVNRHRNNLVPRMRVLSPAEAKQISDRQCGGITTTDKQYRYLRPPVGSIVEVIYNHGQTQPRILYRKVYVK